MNPRQNCNSNALVPLSSEELNLNLPPSSEGLLKQDAEKTRKAIKNYGVVTQGNELAYERDGIAAILCTDNAGANKFIAELPDDEIIEDGNKVYVLQPSINHELSRRIQEPRDAYKIVRLKDSELCLNAARDNPVLANKRLTEEALIRKIMPIVKRDVLKNTDTCISGEPLEDKAEVHHKERVADNPRLALDPNNMAPANPHIHDQIHAAQAHSPQALNELAIKNGWTGNVIK